MIRLRVLRVIPVTVAALLATASFAIAADSEEPACDRVCLEAHVDAYLDALVTRDPNLLPLTPDVKFTENGVHLPLGDAAWGTVSGVGEYRIVVADPQMGEVAFIGVMIENETFPGVMALRLKVDEGRISEIETIWVRDAATANRLEAMGAPRPQFVTPLPPDDQPTREILVATANRYFNALQDNDGTRYVPFTDDCQRMENGNRATNVEVEDTGQGYPAWFMRLGCDEQFRTGLFRTDTDLRERRFRVVDVERGLVFVFVFFDHDATIREFPLTNGETWTVRLGSPQTWQVAELFKIEDGKISQVEGYMRDVPYGMSSGWYDCSGVFPRPCNEPGPPPRKIRLGHSYPDAPAAQQQTTE
jgi:hypothetical protein